MNLSRRRLNARRTKHPPKTPRMGTKVVKEVARGVAKVDPLTPKRRSSAPAATPPPAEGDPKKRPQGDNASPEGNNSKKRQLAWMAEFLMAGGVDVKFPGEA